MKNKLLLSVLLGALAATATSVQATLLVNETWADGDRTNQDLANNSMAWYSSAAGGNVSAAVGSMTQATGTGGRHVLAYFTDAESPATIGVGERMQLNFTVTFPGGFFDGAPQPTFGTNGDFRVGFYNSAGAANRMIADSHGGSNATPGNANFNESFIPYTGYMFTGRILGAEEQTMSLRKRLDGQTGGGSLILSVSPYAVLGDTDPAIPLAPGEVYSGSLTIDRLSMDSALVSYTLSDGLSTLINMTRLDESDAFFTFDTVGFSLGSQTATSFELREVSLSIVAGGAWGGYAIVDEVYVDTGAALGWLYIGAAPWVWVYDLDRWAYIPEPPASLDGIWMFL